MTAAEAGSIWARRAAVASIVVAVFLTALKAVVWIISGSVALLSALADSGVDLAASIGALLAVAYAARPKDAEHRYGHAKAEAVAGLLQGVAIVVSAGFVCVEAARRLFEPQPVSEPALMIAVGLSSLAITFALTAFQSYAIRRSGSLVIAADRLHYVGDIVIHLGVVASGVSALSEGPTWADPLFGFAAALWLLNGARGVLRSAFDQLLDRELDAEVRRRICALAEATPGAHKVRALRTRALGATAHIAFHLDMDPDITLLMSHHIALQAERRIKEAFPGAEVFIHPDPLGWSEDHPDAVALDHEDEPKP